MNEEADAGSVERDDWNKSMIRHDETEGSLAERTCDSSFGVQNDCSTSMIAPVTKKASAKLNVAQ